ncbi:MAG: DUF2520 domain-containing protein [Acidobacteriota bacterium]
MGAAGDAIGIAGGGRIAQAFGRLLREHGEPVAAVASREPEHAAAAARFIGCPHALSYAELPSRACRVLIAVPDDALASVAAALAGGGLRGGAALHTCGSRGPEALAALAAGGVSCGALHPLQTVATPQQGLAALPGAAFAITAEGPAAAWAERIVSLLDGLALRIPAERRPLYHAAAVMASNYLVGLVDAAVMLMNAAGVEEDTALRALAPLVGASSANALALGPLKALTGPIERGDVETVALHWKALAAAPAPVRELYRAAGLHLVTLARRRGLSEASAVRFERLFRQGE